MPITVNAVVISTQEVLTFKDSPPYYFKDD